MGQGQLKVSQKEVFAALLKGQPWLKEVGWHEAPQGVVTLENWIKITIKPPLKPGALAVSPKKGIVAQIDDSNTTPLDQTYTLKNTGQ